MDGPDPTERWTNNDGGASRTRAAVSLVDASHRRADPDLRHDPARPRAVQYFTLQPKGLVSPGVTFSPFLSWVTTSLVIFA